MLPILCNWHLVDYGDCNKAIEVKLPYVLRLKLDSLDNQNLLYFGLAIYLRVDVSSDQIKILFPLFLLITYFNNQ